MSQIVLITGANRGIGLATTAQFLQRGDTVIATQRGSALSAGPESPLAGLQREHGGRLIQAELEVTQDASVAQLMRLLAQRLERLDVVINMAGILPRPHDQPLEKLDFDQCREAFEVNALGPLRVARAALPLLRKSSNPRIVNVTSGCGSLSGKDNGHFYAYGTSKAALNMLTLTLAFEFEAQGICCVALDPGWVRTDLGGPEAPLAPEESAAQVCATTSQLTLVQSKQFLLYDGTQLKW